MAILQQLITHISHADRTVLISSLVGPLLLIVYLLGWRRLQPPKLDLPVVGDITESDFRSALEEGAKRYPHAPFILPTPMHPTVILPQSIIHEVKNLPEHVISLRQHHYTIFLGDFTKFGEPSDELDNAIRVDLTRNVEKNLQLFQDEVGYAYKSSVGDCKEWTSIVGYESMLRIVSLLSSRVFVGLPLSRKEEWIQTTSKYALDGGSGAHSLTPFPTPLRPLVAPFILRALTKHRVLARRMIQPLLAKFSKDSDSMDTDGGDLMRYILSRYKGPVTAERLGRDQLNATFVAMHTTTICITQVLFDLASRLEYVAPLREELEQALKDETNKDGLLHNTTIVRLRKMDSFIRESQRVNPPGLVTMLRHVTAPEGLHLSTGHTIPKGAVVGFSNHMVTKSYSEADKFDGFRFEKLREEPGHGNLHQLTTMGTGGLSFGYGSHACPGRFFAANELKVIFAYLLQNFDVKLADGESRPVNHHRGAIVSPAEDGRVLLRRRVPA